MSSETLREQIRHELSMIAPEADLTSLDERSDVRSELDLDSMDVLRFATALHERFGIDIPESDYAKITSVLGCVEYLQRHRPDLR